MDSMYLICDWCNICYAFIVSCPLLPLAFDVQDEYRTNNQLAETVHPPHQPTREYHTSSRRFVAAKAQSSNPIHSDQARLVCTVCCLISVHYSIVAYRRTCCRKMFRLEFPDFKDTPGWKFEDKKEMGI